MLDAVANQAGQHSVGSALATFSRELAGAGVEEPGGDVRRLLAALLDVPSAALLAAPERLLSGAEFDALRGMVARRAACEPVSRILGVREFYGRPFTISPAVLDPRPDSETLISVALDIVAREGWDQEPLDIIDVGTGSGCLLVTLLCELPRARGTGTDISPAALQIARENAVRHGVADRAAWLQADALEITTGPFQLLITNPPYVSSSDICGLAPEVREFDPVLALDGGSDGLDMYRRLARQMRDVVPAGWLVAEVGFDQAAAVAALLGAPEADGMPPRAVSVHRDLAGRPRCVAMKTRG